MAFGEAGSVTKAQEICYKSASQRVGRLCSDAFVTLSRSHGCAGLAHPFLRVMTNLELPDRRAAVATLVATEGSSPRDAGSRMWVDDRGAIVGSVTIGGCVDARVIEESARVLDSQLPVLVSMALGDEDA